MRDKDRRVGGLPSEKQIGAGFGETERRCDGVVVLCDQCSGWLALAGHDLGERESEHKERKRAEKRRGWGWPTEGGSGQ